MDLNLPGTRLVRLAISPDNLRQAQLDTLVRDSRRMAETPSEEQWRAYTDERLAHYLSIGCRSARDNNCGSVGCRRAEKLEAMSATVEVVVSEEDMRWAEADGRRRHDLCSVEVWLALCLERGAHIRRHKMQRITPSTLDAKRALLDRLLGTDAEVERWIRILRDMEPPRRPRWPRHNEEAPAASATA